MGIFDEVKNYTDQLRQRAQQSRLAQVLRQPVQVSKPVAQVANYFAQATPQRVVSQGVQQQARLMSQPVSIPRPVYQGLKTTLNTVKQLPTSQYVMGRGQTIADRAISGYQGFKQATNPNLSGIQRIMGGVQGTLGTAGAVLGATPGGMKTEALLGVPISGIKTASQYLSGKPITKGNFTRAVTGQESLGSSLNPLTTKLLGQQGGDIASQAIDVASMILGTYKGGKFDPQTKYLQTLDSLPANFNIPRFNKPETNLVPGGYKTEFKAPSEPWTGLKKEIGKDKIPLIARILGESASKGSVNEADIKDVNSLARTFLDTKDLNKMTPEMKIAELYKHAVGSKVQTYASEIKTPNLSVEPTNSLAKEALKYNSAQDFIDAVKPGGVPILERSKWSKIWEDANAGKINARRLESQTSSLNNQKAVELNRTRGEQVRLEANSKLGKEKILSEIKKIDSEFERISGRGDQFTSGAKITSQSAKDQNKLALLLQRKEELQKALNYTPSKPPSVEPVGGKEDLSKITLYHGGSKIDRKINVGDKGFSVTTDQKVANEGYFGGSFLGQKGTVNEYSIKPNAKILSRENIPDEIINQYRKAKIVEDESKAERMAVEFAKKNGYDAVDWRWIKDVENNFTKPGFTESEIKIVNPDVLVKKSPSPLGGKVGEVPQKNLEKIKTKLGIETQPVEATGLAKLGTEQLPKAPQENAVSLQNNSSSDIYYNIDRLNISPEAKARMKSIVNEDLKTNIEKAVGKTLTNQEIVNQAKVVNDSLVKAVGRDQTEAMGAAQLRLRQNIAQMADQGKVTPELLDAIARDKAYSENIARLMQQRTIKADPTTPLGKITQQYLGEVLKVNNNIDEVLNASKGVDFNDPKQAADFYRKFVKPSAGEWIDKLRYSSMLSSPSTHINNAFSNLQGTGILTPIQKTVEGGIDAVISGLTGRDRTRFAGEGGAYLKGYTGAVKDAYKNMLGVIKGTQLSENPDFRSIPLANTGFKGVADRTMSTVSNALEGMDQFFKTLTQRGLESSAKFRLEKGGTKLSPESASEAERLLFRGELVQKGEGAVSNFIGGGAKWVQQATKSKVPAFRWLAKLTLPFVRTGTNIAKEGLASNPITGAFNLIGNEDKIAQASKMIMGGAVMAMATPLALQGRLTFAEPPDQKNKNAFRSAGMKPYSIKIGDKWVSYQRLHPLLAFQLATVAGITDAYEKGKITEDQGSIIAQGLFNGLQFFADQTYFKNIGDLTSAVQGDTQGLARFASNYPTQFIPFRAGLSWLTRILDKYQRQPDTNAGFFTQQMQQIASQLPGASFAVPKRLDAQGQPIENKNRFINAFTPFSVSTEDAKKRKTYDYHTNGLRAYKNLEKLPPKEKGAELAKIKVNSPAIYTQVVKLIKDERLGLTSQDSKIRSMGVADGERARAIASLLNKAKTKEERNKLYGDLYRKGIITKEVSKQLLPLLKTY